MIEKICICDICKKETAKLAFKVKRNYWSYCPYTWHRIDICMDCYEKLFHLAFENENLHEGGEGDVEIVS